MHSYFPHHARLCEDLPEIEIEIEGQYLCWTQEIQKASAGLQVIDSKQDRTEVSSRINYTIMLSMQT